MALDGDPEHQAIAEPEMQDAPPKMGMVARNAWNRKQPKKYVPRMQGNKYQVALTQIGASKTSMAFAQMSVKKALETIKATHKKWGKDAEESAEEEKHRRDFDGESVLQGVSNDRGDSLLSSEMRYEYSHLEAARKETNPKLVLPLQYKNIVKDKKDRAFILVHWDKLCHLMEYLRGNCDRPLILGADNDGLLMWYVDASFAVHPNMHGHTGGGLTLGRGFPITVSTKQKLNTRSSTESELVGVDDMMPIICWTRYFLLSQGYGIIENLLLQDNRSSILLKRNGRASSGKRTRHINIRYYFITDRVNMKENSIDWCPTKKMVADYMSKPLQVLQASLTMVLAGSLFHLKMARLAKS